MIEKTCENCAYSHGNNVARHVRVWVEASTFCYICRTHKSNKGDCPDWYNKDPHPVHEEPFHG